MFTMTDIRTLQGKNRLHRRIAGSYLFKVAVAVVAVDVACTLIEKKIAA